MNARRIAFALAAATAGTLGLASVAWACVPGHDHMSPEEEAEHNAAGVHLPSATPAPAPAPAPAPTAAATQAQTAATQTQTTQAPVATATPVAAATPARTATTVATRTTTPVAVATPAPVAVATPAPAAAGTPAPEAVPASSLVTTAPEVLPSTPDIAPVDAFADTEVEPAATTGSGGSNVLGYALLGLGVALLVGALLTALRNWRSGAGPRPLAD